MRQKERLLVILPLLVLFGYFFLYPLTVLAAASFKTGESVTLGNYIKLFSEPYYYQALINSLCLSVAVTVVSLAIAGVLAFFLARTHFPGKTFYFSLLTFPISFPGVVVGFMIIILFGSTGVIPLAAQALFGKKLLAVSYTIAGIFLAYLYFEIPRMLMTVYGSITECDPVLEEAARTLGANNWQAIRFVVLPTVAPAFISAGALAFSTSMSAFGTAFTLANQFNIFPILMYNEYTLFFKVEMASAIAIVIGILCITTNYGCRFLLERTDRR